MGLFAQPYSQIQYKTEDGLPSNEVFSVTQDLDGYIWLGTDKGITRFDGHKFKTYGIEDGLSSAVVYKLLASPLGGIAFYGSDNQVGFIKHDSISYFAQYSDRLHTIYSTKIGIVVSQNAKSQFDVFDWTGKKIDEVIYSLGHHIMEFHDTLIAFGPMTRDLPDFFITSSGKSIPINSIHRKISRVCYLDKYKGDNLIASDSILTIFDHSGALTHEFLSGMAIGGGLIDSKGRVWVGLHHGGIDVISLDENSNKFHLLEDYTVSSIFQSTDGTIWATTLRHGLFKFRTSHCQPIITGETNHLRKFNDLLVAAQTLSSLQTYNLTSGHLDKFNINVEVTDLLAFQNKLFVSTNPLTGVKLPKKDIEFLEVGNAKLGTYQNQIAAISQYSLTLKKIDTIYHEIPSLGKGYTYFNQVYNDTIYLGRPRGLFRLLKTNNQFVAEKIFSIPTTCLLRTQQGFVCGTKGRGVIFTTRNFTVLEKYSTQNGLSGNFVSFIKQKGDTLICGTDNGLNFMTRFLEPTQRAIYSSHISDGLWSENINDLVVVNNDLFVATDKGVQKLSFPYFSNITENPRAIIEHLNGRPVDAFQTKIVAAGTRNIKIGLNTIFFHEAENYTREYRLVGDNDDWGSTNASELEFLNLSPGEYELQFRTKLAHLQDYSQARLKFNLKPLFYETFFFKIMLALSLLLIFSMVRYMRDRRRREKTQMLVQQEQLRYQALTSQLNPHFIFNALGSIQNLIITAKNSVAAEYLASFSALFDKTLRNTNHLFISLADEMAFIDEYVGIEKSRFEKPIEFNWHISDSINPQIVLVPTMFLQPYIENAIIHGINPLKVAGKIDVIVDVLKPNVIRTIILDNGIGLQQSLQTQGKRARKSMAMQNIQSRLQTMEKLYKDTFSQKTEERIDDHGKVLGTKVVIDIPYKLKSM